MDGIDVSANNGVIDWSQVVKNTTVNFAFIKASEGVGYTDPKFLVNATKAKEAGLKIGYYHFASLNTTNDIADAKAEADYFISVIKKAPPADLPLILDLETNKVGLDKIHVLEWINAFFNELKLAGYTNYAIYSYTPFLNENLNSNHSLGNIPLWIAQYSNSPIPKLPVGWSNYWIHQYSAKGNVCGIKGNVDLNRTPLSIY